MNQETFIQKRNLWLEEVCNQCHEYALKFDKDFLVFQTPCNNYNPELLIIGINPGGDTTYSEILNRKGYSKKSPSDLAYDVNTLTTKPYWESDKDGKKLSKGADVMRNRLGRIFNTENGLKETLEKTVMMNMYYLNTPTEKDLTEISNEAKQYCVKKTIEFIEILNPKNILFLTSKKWNLNACNVTDVKKFENFVKAGQLNNRKVYAIPHYASRLGAYSTTNANLIAKTLKNILVS
ncbi:MAG: hypothetical protein Q8908_05635 [Bacteroidota bacterium]|nr:hypothetical protein [Bacteroidota bacterium]